MEVLDRMWNGERKGRKVKNRDLMIIVEDGLVLLGVDGIVLVVER